MASAMNKRNTKRCKSMSDIQLQDLIKALKKEVPEATSLLDCAERESKRRYHAKRDRESLYDKMKKDPDDGD